MTTLPSTRSFEPKHVWGMLFSRVLLFILVQAVMALIMLATGQPDPWKAAAAWWPLNVTLASLIVLFLLFALFRREQIPLRSIFGFHRESWKKDLLLALLVFVLSGPVAYFPSMMAGTWLFGDLNKAYAMLFQPYPMWAVMITFISFPVTVGLSELPTYYAYVMPRLETLTGSRVFAVGISAVLLAAQHAALPLLFNGPFALWRFLMFFPFALFLGIVLRWRPRLLPYCMIGHILIDFSTMGALLTFL